MSGSRPGWVVVGAVVAIVGSGCGVGVDDAPRPLEPITSVPPQPVPTVVQRPDDGSTGCRPVGPTTAPTTTQPTAGPTGTTVPRTPAVCGPAI